MYGKRVHVVLDKLYFGPYFGGPLLITVNGKKDLADKIVAVDWGAIALQTILHGNVDICVDKCEENKASRYEAKNGMYYTYRRKIEIVRLLNPEEATIYQNKYLGLHNLK